jgi:uncharacterized protein (UPF0147 family)
MRNTDQKQFVISMYESEPSTHDLGGRQSVRATFRLSEACINAISILATQLGIKQKSVFDHLLEDDQVLKNVARELEETEFDHDQRIQKTFVISRKSLYFLDKIANKHNTPRDALVEYSVRRLLPIIANERRKHEKRKNMLDDILEHFTEGEKLVSRAEEILGPDDPISNNLQTAMSAYQNAIDEIVNIIEKGKIIEEFELQ